MKRVLLALVLAACGTACADTHGDAESADSARRGKGKLEEMPPYDDEDADVLGDAAAADGGVNAEDAGSSSPDASDPASDAGTDSGTSSPPDSGTQTDSGSGTVSDAGPSAGLTFFDGQPMEIFFVGISDSIHLRVTFHVEETLLGADVDLYELDVKKDLPSTGAWLDGPSTWRMHTRSPRTQDGVICDFIFDMSKEKVSQVLCSMYDGARNQNYHGRAGVSFPYYPR